jgi:hypothetical protein
MVWLKAQGSGLIWSISLDFYGDGFESTLETTLAL